MYDACRPRREVHRDVRRHLERLPQLQETFINRNQHVAPRRVARGPVQRTHDPLERAHFLLNAHGVVRYFTAFGAAPKFKKRSTFQPTKFCCHSETSTAAAPPTGASFISTAACSEYSIAMPASA